MHHTIARHLLSTTLGLGIALGACGGATPTGTDGGTLPNGMMPPPPGDGGMMPPPPGDGGMMPPPGDGGMMMPPPPGDGGMMMPPPGDGGMMMARTCTTASDCTGACPMASAGCACASTPMGMVCVPSCTRDADCPTPPMGTLTCNTTLRICVPR